MRRVTFVVLAIALFSAAARAEPIKFARYPHVANGKLAFAYHGDIWVAGEDGCVSRRTSRATAFRASRPTDVWSLSPATGSATTMCSSCP